ncbi:MAG: hypothetical protein H7319_15530 [Spirosoma sp.]|nr:hypothetical protein [Spirosoma sp.]
MKKTCLIQLIVVLLTLSLWNCKKNEPEPEPFLITNFSVTVVASTAAANMYRVNYDVTNMSTRRYTITGRPRFSAVFTATATDGTTYTTTDGLPELDPGEKQPRTTFVDTKGKNATIGAEIRQTP